MRKILTILCFVFIVLGNCYAQSKHLLFKTDFGDFKVVLYDYTPNHRDLMLRSIRDTVYQGALFNRIIENFVVQGGEHDIDIEKREAADPHHKKPRLAAEFDDRAFHNGCSGRRTGRKSRESIFLESDLFRGWKENHGS